MNLIFNQRASGGGISLWLEQMVEQLLLARSAPTYLWIKHELQSPSFLGRPLTDAEKKQLTARLHCASQSGSAVLAKDSSYGAFPAAGDLKLKKQSSTSNDAETCPVEQLWSLATASQTEMIAARTPSPPRKERIRQLKHRTAYNYETHCGGRVMPAVVHRLPLTNG